jgi:hypothetical protein
LTDRTSGLCERLKRKSEDTEKNMRKLLFLLTVALIATTAAWANPACTTLIGTNVLSGGAICDAGGLTFSNFSGSILYGAGMPTPLQVNLLSVSVGSYVTLQFTPVMGGTTNNADFSFYFNVTGPVNGVDLTNAGTGMPAPTVILERVCSQPLTNNICPAGTQLAEMTVSGGDSQIVFPFPNGSVNSLYVYKDIRVPFGDELSSFSQSFHTGVPEPMTFVLIGTGLVGIGWIRRRTRKS